MHIPEAFQRRFQEMRSANNEIAQVASLVAGLLYGIGGCVLGALWLVRKRALLWPQALLAGLVVSGLNATAMMANAPQAWFGFDTAQSEWIFWGQQVGVALLILVGGTLGLALVFMTAEGLSRLAFGDHPQLWRLWSRDAAPTRAVLGRTLGGYLFVPIELALIVGFYFVTNRYLGWWQPSESLSDPNILGSALPGLAPIGMALQAGFMEECLFRAVPLSLAALIGARFGVRRSAIAAVLVLQAVVFGAAHANYPGFPAYSRLVELTVPALIWGLIFLRFGLLPTVLLHALFDLVLMSLPVFLVDGTSARLNQALVIAAALVPLAVIMWRRARAGAWGELPMALRNGVGVLAGAEDAPLRPDTRAAAGRWTLRVQQALPLLALVGIVAFVFAGDFRSDTLPLPVDRARAEAIADAALKSRGIELGTDWARVSSTRLASQDANSWLWHKFVWREAGAQTYARLMGNWLAPPLWDVRYARFDTGDVADRAEEWRVTVDGTGNVRQVRHALPEQRAGAALSQDDARTLAAKELALRFGLDAAVAARSVRRAEPATGARRLAVHLGRSARRRRRRQRGRGARHRRHRGQRGVDLWTLYLRPRGVAAHRARALGPAAPGENGGRARHHHRRGRGTDRVDRGVEPGPLRSARLYPGLRAGGGRAGCGRAQRLACGANELRDRRAVSLAGHAVGRGLCAVAAAPDAGRRDARRRRGVGGTLVRAVRCRRTQRCCCAASRRACSSPAPTRWSAWSACATHRTGRAAATRARGSPGCPRSPVPSCRSSAESLSA